MPGPAPSAYMLRKRVMEMVREGDANVLTMRMVRGALENEFGAGTFSMKFVRRLVEMALKWKFKLQAKAEARAEQDKARKAAKWTQKPAPNNINNVFRLSPELQEIAGERVLKFKEVVRKLWDYIRENKLQDPDDKKLVRCTGNKLYELFKEDSVNIFTMNKLIRAQLFPVDEGYWEIDFPKETKQSNAQKPRKEPFLAQRPISRALQSVLKTDQKTMSTAEVGERMWEYILDNDLMKSTGSHRIFCDGKLEKLFQRKSFAYSDLQKLLEPHFVSVEEAESMEAGSETSDDDDDDDPAGNSKQASEGSDDEASESSEADDDDDAPAGNNKQASESSESSGDDPGDGAGDSD